MCRAPCAVITLLSIVALCNGAPAKGAPPRNVLYLVFDDLRPDLSAYGQSFMHTPNIQKLADSGTVFERAYCQQSVCSPSRNSFSTGRRPNSTKVWNFVNHFRQATCNTHNQKQLEGTPMEGGWATHGSGEFGRATTTGGYAQCCTTCTSTRGCQGWNYHNGNCSLLSKVRQSSPCTVDPSESYDTCISGSTGDYGTWTPLPALFKQAGHLTLGSGKYYHDGGHGLGGAPGDAMHPAGQGTPPLADRGPSWSDVPVQWPNQTAYVEKWGPCPMAYGNFQYLVPDDEPCREEGGRFRNLTLRLHVFTGGLRHF